MTVRDIDRGYKRISREISLFGKAKIRVGFFDDEVATYAAFNEFGTLHIPPRPFIRTALEREGAAISDAQEQILDGIISGRWTARSGADALGDFIRRLIQKRIDNSPSWAVRNDPATVEKKGSAHPLIDTGKMRDSIEVKVEF